MGGPGYGRWYRWQGTRTTLEEVYRLDVRWLHRHGYLDGRPHWVTWSRGEQQAGSLLLALQPEGVVLTYRYRVGGGDWSPCARSSRWPGRRATMGESGPGSGVQAVSGVWPCCVVMTGSFSVGTATGCHILANMKRGWIGCPGSCGSCKTV